MNVKNNDYKIGIIGVICCQVIWGFLPIFWQAIKPIDSWIIIAYRIFTMAVFSLIGARFKYTFKEIFSPLKDRKTRIKYFSAGLILTLNWSLYIWAINSERVIQAAIGYYIEPLVICLFGIIIFKEKFTKHNATAMGLAAVAVIIMLLYYGELPVAALGLAFTWAIYSAIKKTAEQPALISLVFETMIYGIISLFVIIYIEANGMGGLSYHMPVQYGLLFLTGLVTVIPVGLFGMSAKKVPLIVIGLAQYISPTITLICGIFLFKEPIDVVQVVSFCIIWCGLIVFTVGEFKKRDEQK